MIKKFSHKTIGLIPTLTPMSPSDEQIPLSIHNILHQLNFVLGASVRAHTE